MEFLVLDLETTTQTYNKRKASPFYPDNWVVAGGYAINNDPVQVNYFADREGWKWHQIPIRKETEVLVGFNIKFDLLYMWSKRELQEFFRRGGRIWDTQYCHYLLQGMQQSAHMVSMDSVIESYGGKLKIDEVKALWEAGLDTPEIDPTLLSDYLARDVDNTRLIFTEQYRAAERHPRFLQMVWNRMDGLLATTEMEYRGLTIDRGTGEQDRVRLQSEYDQLIEELNNQLPELPGELTFNWKSNYHRSALLFGGTIKYQEWKQHTDDAGQLLYAKKIEKEMITEAVADEITLSVHNVPVRYKSGKKKGEIKYRNIKVDDLEKPKGKIHDMYHQLGGITRAKDEWETDLRDAAGNPIYRTGSDVIEELGNRDIALLKALAESQKINKDLGTYYWSEDGKGNKKGMLTLVGVDGRIHHKLNHTSTVTGRLSSSDPNMQNIPRGDKSLAKRMFVSRFGDRGRIIEIDYSQLEVIVQGVLSRDKNLCRDIREGIDFHVKRLAAVMGEEYEDIKRLHVSGDSHISAERTRIKAFTFQRAYGAGVQAIHESTGMPEETIRTLIDAEDRLYPGIGEFDRDVQASIERTAKRGDKHIQVRGVHVVPKVGEWICPTGTRYVWTEKEAPKFMQEKGQYVSFSPTERKNWPVQGLGGEIVQTMIGKVWRAFVKNKNWDDQAFLINTVHDCILIDSHIDVIDEVAKLSAAIMECVPAILINHFNMEVNVPFPVSIETGMNWYDMEHYDG